MTMLRALFIVVTIIPSVAASQSPRSLTVEEAVRLGLQNNRSLHASQMKVAAADARAGEVRTTRFPLLKVSGSYTRLSEIEPFAVQLPFVPAPITISPVVLDNYASRVSLQQPIFSGFKLSNTIAAAEYAGRATGYDYAMDRSDLIFAIRSAYWNLFKALESRRVVDENVDLMERHLADIRNMNAAGLATRNDVLKVEVQLSNSRLSQIDAANAVSIATMSLDNLLGLPLETPIEIASRLHPSSDSLKPVDAYVDEASTARPDLRAAGLRVSASDASLGAARGSRYPQIFLSGNLYYSRPNPRILPTKDEFKNTWDVGVNISFDLWNWGATSYQTEQAEAALEQSQDALQLLKDAASLEVRQSYLALRQAQRKVPVAQEGVSQAEENYRVAQSRFKAGNATSTDLLDAEVTLLQAGMNRAAALVDLELARAQLVKSLGKEEE